MPLPDVSDHLVPVHRLSQFVAGSIVLWGAIPARTSPPEGGLRSWPNERPGDSNRDRHYNSGLVHKNGNQFKYLLTCQQLPCYSVCFKYIQRYTSMNCFKFTHDIDEILENPMMYFIIYVLLMETCLKRFITGIISQYLNFSVVV